MITLVLAILMLGSLLVGQLGALSVGPGVVIYIHELLLPIMLLLAVQPMKSTIFHIPVFRLFLYFVASAAISLLLNRAQLQAPEVYLGSLYLFRWILYVSAVYISLRILTPSFWLRGLYSVAVGLSTFGFLQLLFFPDLRPLVLLGWDPHYYRLFSTLFDPNFTGIILVFGFLLGLYLYKVERHKQILFITQGIIMLGLLFTYSRSSYAALAVGLLVVAILERQWKLLAGFVIAVVIFALIPKPNIIGFQLLRTATVFARADNWVRHWPLAQASPIFGYGFNTIRYLPKPPFDGHNPVINDRAAAGVDNSFYFLFLTTGAVGVFVYVLILREFLHRCRQLTHDDDHRSLGVVSIAILAAILIHSQVVNSMFYPWVLIWMWLLYGVVLRLGRKGA